MISTVSAAAFICMAGSMFLIFLLPVGMALYMHRKYSIEVKAILVGALVFLVFQLLTRIPLLTVLAEQSWFAAASRNLFFSAVVIGGLTAGLFEETGRWLGFRYLLPRHLSWKNGFAFGIGHGGIEAIALVGLPYINNFILSLMINRGTFDSTVGGQLGSEMAWQIKLLLLSTPPVDFLAAGLERALTLIIHVALSLLVLYGVMNRRVIYLGTAVLLHAALNAPAVIIVSRGYSIWAAELYLLLFAAAAAVFIGRSRRLFQQVPAAALAFNDDGDHMTE